MCSIELPNECQVSRISLMRKDWLKLPSLKYRRTRGDMINVFKMLSNEEKTRCQLLPLNVSNYPTRDHDKKFKKCRFSCALRKVSFSLRDTNLWNSLTPQIINASSINVFKKLLDDELSKLQYIFDEVRLEATIDSCRLPFM